MRALGLPLPIVVTSSLEKKTRVKGKIKLYTCTCQPVRSKRAEENEKESATLAALVVECNSVLVLVLGARLLR